MEIVKVALLGIIGVMIATELKDQKRSFGTYIAFAVGLLIFGLSLGKLTTAFSVISDLKLYFSGGEHFFTILLKVVGITYLCEFSSGICKDAGFQAIAGQIQIFGKLYVLLSGMPILLALLETIKGLGG